MSLVKIDELLWVGDVNTPALAVANGIQAIVNVAIELDDTVPAGVLYTKAGLYDTTGNTCPMIQAAMNALHTYLTAGYRTAVHCAAGVNRGPAMAALYYHRYGGWDLTQAWNYIHSIKTDTSYQASLWQTVVACADEGDPSGCENKVECCPESPFILPPPGIAASLSGLLWNMACTTDMGGGFCRCTDPADVITTLAGTPDQVYTVTLRIRGVIEPRGSLAGPSDYSGGSVVSGTGTWCYRGGTYNPLWTSNVYRLDISSPAEHYFLNNNPSGGTQVVDFTFAVQMSAGATITMSARALDAVELDNTGFWSGGVPLSVTVAPGDPPVQVTQPYDGQWLQMDVVSVV